MLHSDHCFQGWLGPPWVQVRSSPPYSPKYEVEVLMWCWFPAIAALSNPLHSIPGWRDTPFVIWVFQHICFPELCCQLPVDLSAWNILWNLSWECVQLGMESFWLFTLFSSAGSKQSPSYHLVKYSCSSPQLIIQACLVQTAAEVQTGCSSIITFSFIEWKLRCK